jgi:hypothetical protein
MSVPDLHVCKTRISTTSRITVVNRYLLMNTALMLTLLVLPKAHADDGLLQWPADWQVENLEAPNGSRQRAVKNDADGEPLMVVELTRAALEAGHTVNLAGVLLQMRKALQVNFSQGGYQSLCTAIRDASLGDLPAAESTCKITLNGNHVLTQTLVAAASPDTAYGLSYAGSAAGYSALEPEVRGVRQTLHLRPAP